MGRLSFGRLVNPPIELLYRATDGTIATKLATNLGANTFKPYFKPHLAQDDSFFSLRSQDGQGNYALCVERLGGPGPLPGLRPAHRLQRSPPAVALQWLP